MALNPLISLQAQAPDVGGAINNALVNTQNFQKTQANRMAMDEATQMAELKSMVQGGEQARLAFQQGGREGLTEFLMNRMQQGPTVKGGRGMQDTQEFLNMVSDMDVSDEQILGQLDSIRGVGERYGILQGSKEGGWNDMQKGMFDIQKKRFEELRAEGRGRNKEIDAELDFYTGTKKALQGLAKEIKNENRSAVSSFFVKLVKTGDPNSAVLASEMLAAMNLQGLAETALKVGTGEESVGAFEGALNAEIAGLDPKQINLKDVLNTADSNLSSLVGTAIDKYDLNQETLGRLDEESRKDLISKKRNERVESLRQGEQPSWYQFIPAEPVDVRGKKYDLSITPDKVKTRAQKMGISEEQARQQLEDVAANYLGWGRK